MRDNQLVFEIEKDGKVNIGTAEDVANIMNMELNNIPGAAQRGICKGWKIREVGMYKKVYEVYENGEVILNGFVDKIAKDLYISPTRVLQASKYGNKILGKYYIKFKEFVLVKDYEEKEIR